MKIRRRLQQIGLALVAATLACTAMLGSALVPNAMADEKVLFSGTTPAVSGHQSETCDWSIDESGDLVIKPTTGERGYISGHGKPWKEHSTYIKTARFEGNVCVSDTFCDIFVDCSRMTSVDVKGLDTSEVKAFGIFGRCSELSKIDNLDKLNTDKATSFAQMFVGCASLKEIDLSNLNMTNVSSLIGCFSNCSNLLMIKFPSQSNTALSDMGSTFSNCTSLKSIDLSTFDTSKVTSVGGLFSGCSNLEEVKGFKGGKLVNIYRMFEGCKSLTDLSKVGFSNYDTSIIQDFRGLFSGCISLKTIDISDKVTIYATDLSSMFESCSSLQTIVGLNTINTKNVTSISHIFSGCSQLKTLDISNFDLAIDEDHASLMFYGCKNLVTIYDDGGFRITAPLKDGFSHFFDGCDNLVGGSGTSCSGWYQQSNEGNSGQLTHLPHFYEASMARIDGGPNSKTPGYFTCKGETPHVHTPVDWSSKSSCTEIGYKNGKKCSVCDTILDKGEYQNARSHKRPNTFTVENKVEATEDSFGSYDKVWRCTECNAVLKTEHVITTVNGNDAYLYPTHTMNGSLIPDSMKYQKLDKKPLTDSWTAEEAAFYISQGLCLIAETWSYSPDTWNKSYVSDASAKKILELAFRQYGDKFGWELAGDDAHHCCSPVAFRDRYEDETDAPSYTGQHNKHFEDEMGHLSILSTLASSFCKDITLSSAGALGLLENGEANYLNTDVLGHLLLKAFPNGSASTSQLAQVGTDRLCDAVANATSLKELKTSANLYKAVGDYIIANADGYYQIAIANKIQLERGNSGGSSTTPSGGNTSGGSSAGTGANAAEITALKSEIASLKAELEKLKKNPGSDNETIAALQATISTLQKSLETMRAALVQTQDSLALSNVPKKLSKNIKAAKGSKVKIKLSDSASGSKGLFKPAKSKYLSISKSGSVKVLKTLKRNKVYTLKTTVTYGDQSKEITLRFKAK